MSKDQRSRMTRRRFIVTSAVGGGGLALGVYIGVGKERTRGVRESWGDAPETFTPNAWLRIDGEGMVTVRIHHTELGQGITTGIATMVAEELDADWAKVRFAMAPVEEVYRNPRFGAQATGGSTSTPGSWEPLREAGAVARVMLIAAAAKTWNVAPASCRTEPHHVVHSATRRRLPYGELAMAASELDVPSEVSLKDPKDYRLIGSDLPRLDIPDKVAGTAVYAIDVSVPDMLTATVVHPPVFGDQVGDFQAAAAEESEGVHRVFAIDEGVAVVADTFWQAKNAAAALQIEWQPTGDRELSSDGLWQRWRQLIATSEAKEIEASGDVDVALAAAHTKLEAEFLVPYQAHATPEPMSCVAHVEPERCRIWTGTQGQDLARQKAAAVTGLPFDQIDVVSVFAGGGFGRRASADEVKEAVQISQTMGAPIKLIWSRQEDIRHDHYRPASLHRVRAGLDQNGKLVAWSHRAIGPDPLVARLAEGIGAGMPYWMPRGLRHLVTGAAAGLVPPLLAGYGTVGGTAPLCYAVENFRYEHIMDDPGVPVGFWRAVGNSVGPFIVECFMDEVAAAAGQDPVAYRRAMLADNARPLAVLERAAEAANWGAPIAAGRYRGVSLSDYDQAYVAMVAEISLQKSGVRVHRVVCAVDCGRVLNPRIVKSQIASGLVFALTATLKSKITLAGGKVEQENFNDFPLLLMSEMPEVEVQLLPSDEPPLGIGEAGVPPTPAAIANAVFAASGKRVRELPISL